MHSVLYKKLSLNITREIISYYLSNSLLVPGFSGSSLRVYNLETNTCRCGQLSLPQFSLNVNCFLDFRTVLLLSAECTCWKVDLLTFQLTKTTAMHCPRSNPGAIGVSALGTAYVFGGMATMRLTSSEKYCPKQEAWTYLPPMPHAKYAFIPCAFQQDIYLPEASSFLDMFDTVKETYRSISYPLASSSIGSVSFIFRDQLVMVLQIGKCVSWDVKLQSCAPSVRHLVLTNPDDAYSSTSPLVYNQHVYWVNWINGELVTFDPVAVEIVSVT